MRIYNTLSRKIEEFKPLNPPKVGMYACGPTVYDYAHIGHGRKYVNDDILRRALTWLGYEVTHVQNVTDVGHLVSDADEGEDKLEKGAQKTGKTVWEVAEFYTKDFYEQMDKLNVLRPDVICKATEHIKEQLALVEKLMSGEFAYDTPEAVYFDISKFPDYGKLINQTLAEKKVGARGEVKTGEYKRHPADFALWFKRMGRFADHSMHWDSPWGNGFPGWHIECSAMSMKYLGVTIDIHTGGEDHISVHHTNEIAQSEAATGKPFVRFWVHHAFLVVDGRKMSKSLNNFYRVEDVEEKGFEPLALRYLYLTAHYRKQMNFTWESLKAAQEGLNNLRGLCQGLTFALQRSDLKTEKLEKIQDYSNRFRAAIENDLQMPEALAVAWEVVKSNIPSEDKRDLIADFDQVLGLDLLKGQSLQGHSRQGLSLSEASPEIQDLVNRRETARKNQDWKIADQLRGKILAAGYRIEDSPSGPKLYSLRFSR